MEWKTALMEVFGALQNAGLINVAVGIEIWDKEYRIFYEQRKTLITNCGSGGLKEVIQILR